MMRKKISQLIVLVFISGLFVSCWDVFTERTYNSANVSSFVFEKHSVCPNLEKYVFNIDNNPDTALIYNLDSLPFGSRVTSLYPKIKFVSSNGYLLYNETGKDTLWVNGDSINFTYPVFLTNYSGDMKYKRVYKINVNVHQVDPDSMVIARKSETYPVPVGVSGNKTIWHGNVLYSFFASNSGGMLAYKSLNNGLTWSGNLSPNIVGTVKINSLCEFNSKIFLTTSAGQLYASNDGLTWTAVASGKKIINLFGALKNSYLIGLAENTSGKKYYTRSTDGLNWVDGNEIDPEFPVSDYALAKGTTVTGMDFFTVASGLNSSGNLTSKVWSTETGLNWISISEGTDARMSLEKRKGASLFFYGKYLVYFGGIDLNGNYIKGVQVSLDKGIGWLKAPDNWRALKMEESLAYTNVYVQHEKDLVNEKDREFLWIFGGSKEGGLSSTVWKGCINSMFFDRR